MTGYIPNDGYTENGYIAAIDRLYDAVRFKYRPFTAEQRIKLISENEKLGHVKASFNTAGIVARKLVEWDLQHDGKPVPITPQNLLHIKPALHDRLLAIIMGLAPGDVDPNARAVETEKTLADELDAMERGIAPGAAAAERDAKN